MSRADTCDRLADMVMETLRAILDRSERDASRPFIDTKLDLVTGADFDKTAPEFMRPEIVYSWIQGRGLEALAGHARWISETSDAPDKDALVSRIKDAAARTMSAMERIRALNDGRVFFCMTRDGKPMRIEEFSRLAPAGKIPDSINFSDLFYSKGLLAAASLLGDTKKLAEAEEYFSRVADSIMEDDFASDQQAFDPKNPVGPTPGKINQGPSMIALGGTALAAQTCGKKWLTVAEKLIQRIISRHCDWNGTGTGARFDFWESVTPDGAPCEQNGALVCDPGHALEFAGLSAKNLVLMKKSGDPALREFAEKIGTGLPDFTRHNFALGFNPRAGGICKAFDLKSRKVINSDMPWWSLPETCRAAALAAELSGDRNVLEIADTCAETFLDRYVNPKVHQMAYQTRNADGEIARVIPATPDADPGYHTGLSIIDALAVMRN